MWYKCEKCGNLFEEGEGYTVRDGHGFNYPPFEERGVCPVCKSDSIYSATPCERCEGIFLEDELTDGMCEDCREEFCSEYKYDFRECVNIAENFDNFEDVKINGFLASMFSAEKINKILYRELIVASTVTPVDCSRFINEDKDWFIESALRWKEGKK